MAANNDSWANLQPQTFLLRTGVWRIAGLLRPLRYRWPHICLITPTFVDAKTNSIQMDASDYSRLAESMADFIEFRTDISVSLINRPPPVSKKQIAFIITVILALTPFFIKRLIPGNTFLHQKNVWMAFVVFVYFFSVLGAMFMADRQDPSTMLTHQSEASRSGMGSRRLWFSWWPFLNSEKKLEQLIAEANANPKDADKQRALNSIRAEMCWTVMGYFWYSRPSCCAFTLPCQLQSIWNDKIAS